MRTLDIINIIAIIVSPVVAVVVGQILQDRRKKRSDKMEIFKTLMISRGLGWSTESVKALNIIEVVFSDDQSVLDQWKIYYDRLCVENPNETELSKIKTEGDKLLDVMAKSLGYKEKVTWETIQKPYIPKGLSDNIIQQQQYQSAQLDMMNLASNYFQNMKNESDIKNNMAKN
ncbi:DUF6680 family protein [Butyrivibrio sp. AE2015]|uniref:DUF6680 family protein n=1 Tax=Butyrivibrio sp. AE2015 TaxID=1280663 RepID=UPI0003B32890|nr:DUF6680 family protein [Butyrivibrio sp. AE2015]